MNAIGLIERKRDGGRLKPDEIAWLIKSYTQGRVPDYQMSSMLMAVFLQGLDEEELVAWTEAMLHSGETLDLSAIDAPKIDKHSTGGVGDKVSIALAPMVAACGVAVPMMSGRGLGHTGGTLDKLESIPGFSPELDPTAFVRVLERTGLVLAGQSETLVPADRKLYALRDTSGTVPSIPLIASSIMSKKLAEDLDGLVLDVKVGRGAFMENEPSARLLAETLAAIGKRHGVQVTALLTNMDEPLGREVGNANEIHESLDVLSGGGPKDLVEVLYRLGVEMLLVAGVVHTPDEAHTRLETAVQSGQALEKFALVVQEQGGDPRVIANPSILPQAANVEDFPSPRAGFITQCDARAVGEAAMRLGAGRERKEDSIDHAVGISLLAKEGDRVEEGEPLARIAWNDPARREAAQPFLDRVWRISSLPASRRPMLLGEVRA